MVTLVESYRTSSGQLESTPERAIAWEMESLLKDKYEHFTFSQALVVIGNAPQVLNLIAEYYALKAARKGSKELSDAAAHLARSAIEIGKVP